MTAYNFSQLIDFTRTSSATYVDSTGKIVSTPASRNLLTFTQEFDNAVWGKTAATVYPFDPATASVGANVVTNGDFASATGWTASAGWVIGSGVATATATSSSLYGGFTSVSGQWYKITFDCTITSGTLIVAVGLGTSASFTTSGTKTVFLQSGASTSRGVEFYGGAVTGTVDNVVAQPVTIGLLAPDGTSTADTLTADGTSNVHLVSAGGSGSATGKTFSIYAKAGTNSFLQVYFTTDGNPWANFDLTTGTVGSVGTTVTASISAVGDGWYRCIVATSSTTAANVLVNIIPSATSARAATSTLATTVFLWGAQLETGTTATAYTRNYGGLFPPRFDYDPVTLAPKGLLIEEQRTNLLLRSEEFDNAAWASTDVTISANALAAPDGTTTAETVTEGSAGTAFISQGVATTGGTTYTASVFVKRGNTDWLRIVSSDNTNSYTVWVNTATGALGGNATIGSSVYTSSSITGFGNGWYRVTLTGSNPLALNGIRVNSATANLSNTRVSGATYSFWGAQLEAGSFATSYIPTVASQVTRTADQASIAAPNFASWYNAAEGTLVAEVQKLSPSGTAAFAWELIGSSSSFSMRTRLGTDSRMQAVDGGVTQVDAQLATPVPTAASKYALAYKANDFAGSAGGAAAVTDTSATVPAVTSLSIGSASVTNLYIRSIRYYPTRLSNAQLQALTA